MSPKGQDPAAFPLGLDSRLTAPKGERPPYYVYCAKHFIVLRNTATVLHNTLLKDVPTGVHMANPTDEAYTEFRLAFDHFNNYLFQGKLEVPMFTFQREKKTLGFHSKKSFVSRATGQMVDEIAMNPAYFAVRTVKQTLSTLAHEMVHQWQDGFGHPGRGRYHNKEWAFKMREIGLEPTDTGDPGGKDVGDKMSHYIIPSGKFEVACDELMHREFPQGSGRPFQISWLDRYPAERPQPRAKTGGDGLDLVAEDHDDDDADMIEAMGMVEMPSEEPVNKSNRIGFTCTICKQNAWGKPGLVVLCGMPECKGQPLVPGISRKQKKPE